LLLIKIQKTAALSDGITWETSSSEECSLSRRRLEWNIVPKRSSFQASLPSSQSYCIFKTKTEQWEFGSGHRRQGRKRIWHKFVTNWFLKMPWEWFSVTGSIETATTSYL